jgi:dihydroxyacetone kinase/dihydroxyacetone kinase-like protein
MFRSIIEGIKKRGNCDLGDKTYLDALVPAIDTLEKAFNEGKETPVALEEAAVVARESAEATRILIAKRGRASYTGERSIGTLDAGAVAVAVIFEAISKAWKE